MSVLIKIKDMKMPSSCLNCKFTDKKFTSLGVFINCNFGLGSVVGYSTGNHVGDRHPNCPLVELPEHHGRLFDQDDVKEVLYDMPDTEDKWDAITLLEWAIDKRWCIEAE